MLQIFVIWQHITHLITLNITTWENFKMYKHQAMCLTLSYNAKKWEEGVPYPV
jgi:hypothetical protein